MPESELSYFADTLEWIGNPDHAADAPLFAGTTCRVDFAPLVPLRSWISLAKRAHDELPLPYTLCFLARRGIVLQFHVPLCTRDQDLDGRKVRMPRRPFTEGKDSPFERIRFFSIPLAVSVSGPGAGGRHPSRARSEDFTFLQDRPE